MKKILMALLAGAMLLAGGVVAFAAETYDPDEVAIMNNIIEKNWGGDNKPPLATPSSIPEEWDTTVDYIKWKNIDGTNHISEIRTAGHRLAGELDFTGLTYLESLRLENVSPLASPLLMYPI